MQIHYTGVPSSPNDPEPNDPGGQNQASGLRSSSSDGPAGQQARNVSSAQRVTAASLWQRLFQIIRYPPENNLVVGKRTLRPVSSQLRLDAKQMTYTGSGQAKRRAEIERLAKQLRPRIAKVQFGVWYRRPDALLSQRKTFSIEYERDFLRNGVACIDLIYERSLFRINVSSDDHSARIKLTSILR
jgi:hypothetical protein